MPSFRFVPLFAGRFRALVPLLALFLAFNALVRFGLLIFNGDASLLSPAHLVPIFAIGLLFDFAAGVWWLSPFALVLALWPNGPRSCLPLRLALAALAGLVFLVWAFVGVAEFVFWNEFASRFNFIAVDYLLYTREVIGNIRQSYDLPPLFALVGALVIGLLALAWPTLRRAAQPCPLSWPGRLARLAFFLALPALSFLAIDARMKEYTHHAQAVQLAGNGQWEFWHAFRANEIDYPQFYRTEVRERLAALLRGEFEREGAQSFAPQQPLPIEREVVGRSPEKRLNVVLIMMESLSAEFLAAFGDHKGLTPRLNQLAETGMLFTRVYATGTRTVRGLEAVTLSIPPLPGHSLIKRPDNAPLFTLGEVFAEHGYESLFLYGGYGYFDDMNAFFAGNGYTVIDRTTLPKEAIHMENIWGVCDEDLYSLALAELDRRAAAGKRFFAHIMTTSNHRPFTYPEGRIDIPSGSGREGAVKYSDWALGDFLDRAKTRPWFRDTLFVILADHTAAGRGKTDLPVEQFHIPLIVWAPDHVAPARIDTLASQIDVGPTVLGLLGFGYRSRFFGHDILRQGPRHPRAFLANYQTLGYLEDGLLVELTPQRRWRLVDPATGREAPHDAHGEQLLAEAIAYYQSAFEAYKTGVLRRDH